MVTESTLLMEQKMNGMRKEFDSEIQEKSDRITQLEEKLEMQRKVFQDEIVYLKQKLDASNQDRRGKILKSKWVWPGNTTLTDCRQTDGTVMPRLHLLRSSYDLFVYDFPYDFFGIVGGYKLRRLRLHCLRSPYDFFRRQTRTKPYRDLADIVRRPQGYRAVIVLSSRPPYTNRTMPVRLPCGSRKESVLWLRICRVSMCMDFNGHPCSFLMHFWTVLQSHVMSNHAMKRLVFFVEHGPIVWHWWYLTACYFVYILMSILSSAVFIKFKSQIIYLFICLFIYTIFQEGDLFSSTASLPYGLSEHITDIQTNSKSPLFIVHFIIRKVSL